MADGSAKAKIADAQLVAHTSIEEALAAAQQEFPEIEKTKTAKVKGKSKAGNDFNYEYKYADIADILKAIRPILGKHGIACTQSTQIDGRALTIKSALRFRAADGPQIIESDYPVCEIGSDHQTMGGALTYARRYAFCSIVGIAPDEDIDGDGAAPSAAPERKAAPAKIEQKITPVAEPKRDLTPAERMKNFKIKLSQAKTSDEAIVLWESPRAEELRAALTAEQRAELADYYGQVCSREGAFA